MGRKKNRRSRLAQRILTVLLALFLMTDGFAAAGAGNLPDDIVIVEGEIDLTDDGPLEPEKSESDPEIEIETVPRPETEAGTGTRPEVKPETESGTRPGVKPETESGTRPGVKPETESGTRPGVKPETETGTQPEVKPETETGTHPGVKPETETGTHPEVKPETESETRPEVKPETEAETQFETETQPETESETETETETEFETETETELPLEPEEELKELLDQAVKDRIPRLAAAQYLGLDRLKEAAKKKGLSFELRAWLEEETAQGLGISEEFRKNSYYKLFVQKDPIGRQWLFDTGLVWKDSDLYSLGLYGNREMLMLSLPWLYEKAIGIRSGNLYRQMKGSWASDAAEKIPAEDRDIELNFYPDQQDLDKWRDKLIKLYGYEEDIEEQYEKLLTAFRDSLIYSRTEEDQETVYTAEMEMDAARDLYLGWFDLYYSPMTALGVVTEEEFSGVRADLEEEFEEFREFIPENPSVRCYARDGKLDRIVCGIPVDTSKAGRIVDVDSLTDENDGGMQTGIREYKVRDSANTQFAESKEDTAESSESGFPIRVETDSEGIRVETPSETDILKKGYLEAEIVFREETDGVTGTDISFNIRDAQKNLYRSVRFTVTHTSPEEGGTVRNDLDITIMKGEAGEEAEAVYSSTLVSGVFDPETGHYDIRFSLTDPETKKTSNLTVESRFTEVVPGESFTWDIDRIRLGFENGKTGLLEGQVRVQARPENLVQPEDPVMLFDLSEEELAQIGSTISENLNRLAENELEEKETDEEEETDEEMTETGKQRDK